MPAPVRNFFMGESLYSLMLVYVGPDEQGDLTFRQLRQTEIATKETRFELIELRSNEAILKELMYLCSQSYIYGLYQIKAITEAEFAVRADEMMTKAAKRFAFNFLSPQPQDEPVGLILQQPTQE